MSVKRYIPPEIKITCIPHTDRKIGKYPVTPRETNNEKDIHNKTPESRPKIKPLKIDFLEKIRIIGIPRKRIVKSSNG